MRSQIVFILAAASILSGCSGLDRSNTPAGPPPENQAPTVNAGADQSVDEGTTVNLSGTGMDDDTITSYGWLQDSGTAVTITNANMADASFVAPTVTASEVLVFRVTVTDNDGATGSDTVAVTINDIAPPPPPVGILLPGNDTDLVLDIVYDYDSGDRTTPAEISISADGRDIDRTNVQIALLSTATVGEANTLLQSVGGLAVHMAEGVNIIVVKIPDPGDLTALDAVIADIEASPIVRWVLPGYMGGFDELPANYDPATTDLTKIDHNIAVLAPAAWNAKAAIGYSALGEPLLLQRDVFGNGQPNGDFDINVLNTADFAAGNPTVHGYHVLGIISGRHTTDAAAVTNRDLVTGMYPGTLDVRTVDWFNFNQAAGELQIAKIVRRSGRRVVLNTSMHSGCPRPPQVACVRPLTLAWLEAIRGTFDFERGAKGASENFVLHITSAGNFKPAEGDITKTAAINSQYNEAKLTAGLTTADGTAVPNVTNTLVVENRVNTAAPFQPACLAANSKYPGDISAIGEAVWSFTDFALTSENSSGTSMSTPQVAGLAAYVWALKPTLSPEGVIDILQKTSRAMPGDAACVDIPKPVIDAYAATLAVDDADALDPALANPMDAPARLAIFDVADSVGNTGSNRAFDQYDLSAFVDAFVAAGGTARDFSRFDLNGDGYTGGTARQARFNLDIDAASNYGAVMQDIDGTVVTYDENLVTDWEVLCYYAYSPLYAGVLAERTAVLGSHLSKCGAKTFAYISNSEFGTVSVIDLTSNTVVATVRVGDEPFGVAVRPGGSRVYVTNGLDDSVSVIDATTNTVIATVSVGFGPKGIAVHPDGSRVYVVHSLDQDVIAIDTTSNSIVATVNGGERAFGVAVHPDGSRVYVTNDGDDLVTVIDTATFTVVATVPVGGSPQGVAVHPDGSRIYVANRNSESISVIDATTNTVIATVPVGVDPFGVAVHPDGSRVYVTNSDDDFLSIIDTTTNTVAANLLLGSNQMSGVAVHPDGSRVYVVNRSQETVSVIDTATNIVIATVPVGFLPTAFGQFIVP